MDAETARPEKNSRLAVRAESLRLAPQLAALAALDPPRAEGFSAHLGLCRRDRIARQAPQCGAQRGFAFRGRSRISEHRPVVAGCQFIAKFRRWLAVARLGNCRQLSPISGKDTLVSRNDRTPMTLKTIKYLSLLDLGRANPWVCWARHANSRRCEAVLSSANQIFRRRHAMRPPSPDYGGKGILK